MYDCLALRGPPFERLCGPLRGLQLPLARFPLRRRSLRAHFLPLALLLIRPLRPLLYHEHERPGRRAALARVGRAVPGAAAISPHQHQRRVPASRSGSPPHTVSHGTR